MKKYKMLLVVLTALCLLIPALLSAQVDTAWVRRYNGPGNGIDSAFAIVSDNAGNVYITGTSSSTSLDYATIKYNSSGVQQWVTRYNGPGNGVDIAHAIVLDTAGNVYVTGRSTITTNNYDFATIKYNATGETLWVRHFHGPQSFDIACCITVDASGNVYVSGYSYATSSEWNIETIKYNSLGDTIWTRQYNGPANSTDVVTALAIDASGNVYVTGYSEGSGYNYDYITIKYNSSGDTVWTRRYNGPGNNYDYAYALAVDASGNVYITGAASGSETNYDYATIKYNASGETLWLRKYNGPASNVDRAMAMTIDASGNVYVTGYSDGGGTSYDYATIKYNSNGQEQWVQRYEGPGYGTDLANAIKLDTSGNIYITGYSMGAALSYYDYATVKYNSNGVQQWVIRYNGLASGDDYATSLVVNQSDVYITGYSIGTGSGLDYTTIKYVQTPQGVEEERLTLDTKRNTLEVYPNPAKTYFTVRLPQSADRSEIKIFDITGKEVKEFKSLRVDVASAPSTLRVSLDRIKNGIYFVKVGGELINKKLIVTK